MKKIQRFLRGTALLAVLSLLVSATAFAASVPDPTSDFYVNDYVGVLSGDTKSDIVSKNDGLYNATGAQIVVTMFSKPLMGRVSDSRGRRPLIVTGLLLCAFSFAAVPFMSGFWTLLPASLVFGLGEALVTSSSAAMVADMCRERHFGSAMGAFGTIFDIGHASGPILAGLLVGWKGYQVSFSLMAAVLVAAIPLFLKNVPQES